MAAEKKLRDEEYQCHEASCRGVNGAREMWSTKEELTRLKREARIYESEQAQLRTNILSEAAENTRNIRRECQRAEEVMLKENEEMESTIQAASQAVRDEMHKSRVKIDEMLLILELAQSEVQEVAEDHREDLIELRSQQNEMVLSNARLQRNINSLLSERDSINSENAVLREPHDSEDK